MLCFATHFTNHHFITTNSCLICSKNMRALLVVLLLCSLLFTSSFLVPVLGQSPYCAEKCKGRCAKAGVQDRCLKYCGICCEECKCVPSGTYGNKHECPCYRDKKSKKGTPKCP